MHALPAGVFFFLRTHFLASWKILVADQDGFSFLNLSQSRLCSNMKIMEITRRPGVLLNLKSPEAFHLLEPGKLEMKFFLQQESAMNIVTCFTLHFLHPSPFTVDN